MTALWEDKGDNKGKESASSKATSKQAPAPEDQGFKEFQVFVYSSVKQVRDNIDQAAPRILMLSPQERSKLNVEITSAIVDLGLLTSFRGGDNYFNRPPRTIPKDRSEAQALYALGAGSLSLSVDRSEGPRLDKHVEALRSMGRILAPDPEVPKEKRAEYEAYVQKAWKEKKAVLDELLEQPYAKKLVEAKGQSSK